mmetsp:Transcript_41854/g.100473  ORF Transcript_41854/g.100473 Transcript_41854/m.100473 type:complete len:135 (-) Transcript_41854:718-1122(-)
MKQRINRRWKGRKSDTRPLPSVPRDCSFVSTPRLQHCLPNTILVRCRCSRGVTVAVSSHYHRTEKTPIDVTLDSLNLRPDSPSCFCLYCRFLSYIDRCLISNAIQLNKRIIPLELDVCRWPYTDSKKGDVMSHV